MSKTTHSNPVSGRPFKQEEVSALDDAMRSRRFAQPRWATFQQWKGSGRVVKKGEEGIACTGATGFTWKVFNVAQLEGDPAEAARAPVPVHAPAPSAPSRKRRAKSAPESKKSVPSGAPSAPAVTAKAAAAIPMPDASPERLATIIRCNPFFTLSPREANRLRVLYPSLTHFDPEHVAAIYNGAHDADSARGRFRLAEAKRWLALWQPKAKNSATIGKLKIVAWLQFTGRAAEAKLYGKRTLGVHYAAVPALPVEPPAHDGEEPAAAPAPQPATVDAPAEEAPAVAASLDNVVRPDWRAGFRAKFVKVFGAE